jgi:hypothetical protein
MEILDYPKLNHPTEERVQAIVDLSRRRDPILDASEMDLEGLTLLAVGYETANRPRAAVDLQRRMDWHKTNYIE